MYANYKKLKLITNIIIIVIIIYDFYPLHPNNKCTNNANCFLLFPLSSFETPLQQFHFKNPNKNHKIYSKLKTKSKCSISQ